MNPMTRTITFVLAAAGSVALAAVTHRFTRPPEIKGFENVGNPFYADTLDPNKATGLRVIAFNEETAQPKTFSVEFKDGAWRIPSHHFYPADGGERLAKTASSVMAVKRGALISLRKTDHEQYGVIDPLDEDSTSLKGRGQRVTLFDGQTPMVDFIIGKPVEGRTGEHYIRRKDEDATYITRLELDVSTKFSDWIEPDLLKLDRDKLVALKLKKPILDLASRQVVSEEVTELTREKSSDPWKLDGLDDTKEEVNETDVRTLVSALDDLRIVGIRPKPRLGDKPLLTGDLKLSLPKDIQSDPEVVRDIINVVSRDLENTGFAVGVDENKQPYVISQEGGINAATNEGVVYHLNFGRLFTGSEEEIEIGGGNAVDAKPDEEGKAEGDDAQGDADPLAALNADAARKETAKNRYLFVRVEFDESRLGEKPVKPTAPEKPEDESKPAEGKPDAEKPADAKKPADEKPADEKKPAAEKKPADADKPADGKKPEGNTTEEDSDEDAQDDEQADDAAPGEKSADDKKPADEKPADEKKPAGGKKSEADGKPAAKPDAAADADKNDAKEDDTKKDDAKPADGETDYQKALKEYEQALQKYQVDKAEFDRKSESGKKLVKELNSRFADWYYVISAKSFDSMRLTRENVVKAKEPPAEEKKPEDESKPADEPKPAEEKKPADEAKPAEEKKPVDEAKPAAESKDEKKDEKSDGGSKSDSKKPAPADDAKDSEKKSETGESDKPQPKADDKKKAAPSEAEKPDLSLRNPRGAETPQRHTGRSLTACRNRLDKRPSFPILLEEASRRIDRAAPVRNGSEITS